MKLGQVQLKALDTVGKNSWKIIVSIKTYLGNKQLRAVRSIKHCEKQLPLKYIIYTVVLKKKSNFSLKYFNWIWSLSWGLKFKHLKACNLCDKGVFFLPLFSSNFDDQLGSYFHRFVIIHQVRRLVLDNVFKLIRDKSPFQPPAQPNPLESSRKN